MEVRGGAQPPWAEGGPEHVAEAAQSSRKRLVLHAVELEAFKSYRERTLVGSPFGPFTAVVGPNGCGKSVVGEAIAFALGGNARMMRARNLGALVNHGDPAPGGAAGTAGAASAAAAAEVILHCNVLQESTAQHIESGAGGGGCGAVEQGAASAVDSPSGMQGNVAQHPTAPEVQPAGRLLIRRRVTRSGRSELSVKQVPAEAGAAPSSGGGEGRPGGSAAVGGGSTGQWRSTTPAQLRDLLAGYGIQTEAMDRIVVTQHRQAVQVADPAGLACFLELLIGTAEVAEQLAELEREAAVKAGQYDDEEDRAAGLEQRQQQLAPEVARWRRYEAQHRQYSQRKVEVLTQQASLLERQLASLHTEGAALESQLTALSSEQAAAKAAADGLLDSKAAAGAKLKQAEKGPAKLGKRAAAAQLQAAKLGVQLKAAEAAAAAGDGGAGQQLQKRVVQAQREADTHREVLGKAAAVLSELRADEAAISAQVDRLRAELAAPGGSANLAAEVAAAQHAADAAGEAHAAACRRHEQAVARVAALEAELAAAAAAAARQQQAQQEAAALVQQLQAAVRDRQPQVLAADAQVLASRQQQYALAAAAQQAQAALRMVEARLADLERPPGAQHARHDGSGSTRQTPDQAVQALASASVPGTFHGRLHSVLRLAPQRNTGVPAEAASTAVNAALLELVNLGNLLVVSDRPTAQQVVSHFERHRVGVATCKILSELHGTAGSAGVGGSAAGSGGLVPLVACVEPNPPVQGAAELAQHLLRGWWVAPHRQAAMAAVQADRQRGGPRRSIVTCQGEVFKADGEVVGARTAPAHLRPYLLSPAYVPPMGSQVEAGGAGGRGTADQTEAEKAQLKQRLPSLKAEAERAAAAAEEAARHGDTVAVAAQQMAEQLQADASQLASAERRLKQLQGRPAAGRRPRGGPGQQAAQQPEQQLGACREEAERAEAAVVSAAAELATAQQQLATAKHEYEAAMRGSSDGTALLAAEKELELLGKQAGGVQQEAAAAEAALAAASRRHQKLGAARQAAEAAAGEAEKLREQLEGLQSAAEQHQAEAAGLAAAVGEQRQECSRLEMEWRAAVQQHEGVTQRHQQQQKELREVTAAQERAQLQLGSVRSDLAEAATAAASGGQGAPTDGRGPVAEQEHVAGGVESAVGAGGDATEPLQQQQQQQPEEQPPAGSEGDEEEEERPRRQRRRIAHAGASSGAMPSAAVAAASSKARGGAKAGAPSTVQSGRSKRRLVTSSSSSDSEVEKRTGGSFAKPALSAGAGPSKRVASASRRQGPAEVPPALHSRRSRSLGGQVSEGDEESDSDFESAPASRRKSTAATAAISSGTGGRRQRRQHLARGRSVDKDTKAAAAAAGGPGSLWGAEQVQAALDELAEQEQQLKALRGSLAESALQQDAAVAAQLEQACQRLDRLADSLAELQGSQAGLQEERYSRFHNALTTVNSKLTGIYSRLTGGQGDAYCSYTQDRVAAFADGVVFHVRPDRQRWRPFASLSGGQQALATLALCFALQAAAPSPFYYFDEIDCALDTVNAARVAEYIAAQQEGGGGAQFLVVSHKPQVYERAGCLVGVASRLGASHAVTVHVGAPAQA